MLNQTDVVKYLLIFLTSLLYVSSNEFYNIGFTRVDCLDHNPKSCGNLQCNLKRFRNNSNPLSVSCDNIYVRKVFTRFTLYYKFGQTYKPFLFNMTKNVCELLSIDYKQGADVAMLMGPIVSRIKPAIKCPLKGNFTLTNLLASDFVLPPIVPAGDYRIDVRLYDERNETLVFPRIFYVIKAKGIVDLAMG